MTIEENLKKALTELLVLALLRQREYYALELAEALPQYSGGAINIVFPYAVLYRMIDQGYIQELPKRKAPDGRRRQYFAITEKGNQYFQENWIAYKKFITGVDLLISTAIQSEPVEE